MQDRSEKLSTMPRRLGSEWNEWNGSVEENNGDLDTSVWYSLLFGSIALLLISISLLFLNYLSYPRLYNFHPHAAVSVTWLVSGLILAGFIGYGCVLLTVLTERPFAFFLRRKEIANSQLVPLILAIGQKAGLSKDRLRNSLLKVSNSINRALYTKVHPDELLILVPRCLSGLMRKELKQLTEQYGVTFHTASGGNKARELLVTERPKAVIGVACERDLFSGVQDVGGHLPVLTVANKRPSGPCINTHICLQEMEDAIRFFLGK
jgi:uncharacterized protein